MALSDIVQVTISTVTTTPTRAGFGIPLVMSFHTNFAERVRSYTSLQAMVDDGFATTDPAYLAVQALFSQNPRPARALVGREENTNKKKINLVPTAQNDTLYRVTVNGQNADYTSDATATVAEITAGLKTEIDALSLNVTVTDNTTDLDIEANTVADWFRLVVADRSLIAREETTADSAPNGIVEDIQAVQAEAENDDWYGLVLTGHGKAVISAAAAYIETVIKLLVVNSADDGILDSVSTTDIAYVLESAAYARTALIYHAAPDEFAGAAWQGRVLPTDPGSATWKFKTLSGVTVDDLSDTERTNILNKTANLYIEVAGVNITEEGWTAAREFIDVTRGVDWTRARLQENVFGRLAALDKVPYTDPGVAIVEAEVRGVLQEGIGNGLYAADPAPTVSVPAVADVPTADRANRLLPDVEFTATLAGAIHSVQITGVVSV